MWKERDSRVGGITESDGSELHNEGNNNRKMNREVRWWMSHWVREEVC